MSPAQLHAHRVLAMCAAVSCAIGISGCADDSPNCRHRVCDIEDASCAQFVAEVVACQRDVPAVRPNIRFATSAEIIAERTPPTPAELDLARNYFAGEALVGLMPDNYDPADEASDSISGVLAQYRPVTEEIVIVSDANIEDDELAYSVLVHEMIHAQQDAEYDLEDMFDRYATTFPRSLGLRAAVEGEASLFTTLARLELDDLSEDEVDWEGYFRDWQDEMWQRGRDSQVPSLEVTGLFPYAFGAEQVYRAWRAGGLDEVRDYVQQPPDSARQVLAGYANRPPEVFNRDAELDPAAVPILPGYTYLSGGGQDAWLLNTMLQRIAGSFALQASGLDAIEADHLSVWLEDASGQRVAVWRFLGDSASIRAALTGSGSRWVEDPQDATTHHLRAVGQDWFVVATETPNAVEVADAITGWQSQAEAIERAGLVRAPSPRALVLRAFGP